MMRGVVWSCCSALTDVQELPVPSQKNFNLAVRCIINSGYMIPFIRLADGSLEGNRLLSSVERDSEFHRGAVKEKFPALFINVGGILTRNHLRSRSAGGINPGFHGESVSPWFIEVEGLVMGNFDIPGVATSIEFQTGIIGWCSHGDDLRRLGCSASPSAHISIVLTMVFVKSNFSVEGRLSSVRSRGRNNPPSARHNRRSG